MGMIEFQNPKAHAIQLIGPNKEVVVFKKFAKKILSEWYKRYSPKELVIIRHIGDTKNVRIAKKSPKLRVKARRPSKSNEERTKRRSTRKHESAKKSRERREEIRRGARINSRRRRIGKQSKNLVVATAKYHALLQDMNFSISNDIGIGILSFNRLDSIKRLIGSIRRFTDLKRTTVFVSDESTDLSVKKWLSDQDEIVILNNKKRLGVAGNTNRLFRCLSRFRYKIILNDDVEILRRNWDRFYIKVMKDTGYHHFCYREPGIYGANENGVQTKNIKNHDIKTIKAKPHGAVMAFDDVAFEEVGFFDEKFGKYGMEHVDWSNRVSLSKIQPSGFHDVSGSKLFFKIHKDKSSTENKSKLLREAKKRFDEVSKNDKRIYVNPLPQSEVPGVTYVIPFRSGRDRCDSIISVMLGVKSQKFPKIEIIMSEQDAQTRIDLKNIGGDVKYVLSGRKGQAFTKALAVNRGVMRATNNKIIIHDADMVVNDGYTMKVFDLLDEFEGLHIGSRVFYLDNRSTNRANLGGKISRDHRIERYVTYYEGGSIACRKNTFLKIGGFHEIFEGYGAEDCEFFERLSRLSKFHNERTVDLIHLWHGRTSGWEAQHSKNKQIWKRLTAMSIDKRGEIGVKELKKRYPSAFK